MDVLSSDEEEDDLDDGEILMFHSLNDFTSPDLPSCSSSLKPVQPPRKRKSTAINGPHAPLGRFDRVISENAIAKRPQMSMNRLFMEKASTVEDPLPVCNVAKALSTDATSFHALSSVPYISPIVLMPSPLLKLSKQTIRTIKQ